jgi:hypothetical protein
MATDQPPSYFILIYFSTIFLLHGDAWKKISNFKAIKCSFFAAARILCNDEKLDCEFLNVFYEYLRKNIDDGIYAFYST